MLQAPKKMTALEKKTPDKSRDEARRTTPGVKAGKGVELPKYFDNSDPILLPIHVASLLKDFSFAIFSSDFSLSVSPFDHTNTNDLFKSKNLQQQF